MSKKKLIAIIIIVILVLVLLAGIGYIVMDKINTARRDYQIENIESSNYFVLKQGEKYGVINTSGEIVIEATYDLVKIPNPMKDVFICYEGEKSIAINSEGKQLFTEYNTVEPVELNNVAYNLPYEKSVLKCEKNGQYGLINFDGEVIVDTIYQSIESFSYVEGQLLVQKDDKYGIINIKGVEMVAPEYDEILSDNYYSEENEYKSSGYIVGIKNENGYRYGYINSKGKLDLKVEYNDISRVIEIEDDNTAYLIAAENGLYGVRKNKSKILENEYQSIEYEDTANVFIIEINSKYGVADMEGNIIVPVEYSSIEVKGINIYAQDDDVQKVFDSTGTEIDMDFNQAIMETSNENYKIVINTEGSSNYYGVLNSEGQTLIPTEYLYIEYAFDNYFIVCGQNGKLGVMDSEGNTVIDLQYDLVQKLQNKNVIQILKVAETNITEIYSADMEKVCSMENATVENNSNYIKVYSDTEIAYYNNDGTQIESAEIFTNNKLFAKSENGKWGFVDSSGNTIVEYEYDKVTEFNEYGFAAIKQGSKWGCINDSGEIVVEPTYEVDSSYGDLNFVGKYFRVQSGYGEVYYTDNI